MKITLTLTNGTKTLYDAALATMSLSYGADGSAADTIFDTDHKIGCNFSQKVLPGKKATAVCGFSVPKGGLGVLQAQVSVGDFTHDSAVFTGSLK